MDENDQNASDNEIEENDDWCESPIPIPIYTKSSSEINIEHITNNDQWHPATLNSPISLILRPNMDSVAISIGEHEIHLFFRDIRYTKLSNFGEITINLNRDYEKKYYKTNYKDGRLFHLNNNPFNDIFDDAFRLVFTPTRGVSATLRQDFVDCLNDQLHKDRSKKNQNQHRFRSKKFHRDKNRMNPRLRQLLVQTLKKQSAFIDCDKKQAINEKAANNNVPNNVPNSVSNNVSNSASNNASYKASNNVSNNGPFQKQIEKIDKKPEFAVIVKYGLQTINIKCHQSATLANLTLIAETLFSLISIENLQYKNIDGNMINIQNEEDWNVAKMEMYKENNDRIEVYIQS
ncbi:hypothetical protein F8M41_004731 [Gigaspora margarita]|uniref:PB1 domain-containing protein n=1 Tax=Gigaspora margarita TaxID=4874 RepID=A0A8H4A566_GIGMA|nr:hypothetical protein F8M41_004731 [Gigaspora margarita]